MGLRIKEDFHMGHPLSGHLVEIGPGEIMEVTFLDQNRHAGVIEVEKVLQTIELIGGVNLLHRSVGKFDPVAPGQRQHHFGLKGSLDMQVEFGLGQAFDELFGIDGHGCAAMYACDDHTVLLLIAKPNNRYEHPLWTRNTHG